MATIDKYFAKKPAAKETSSEKSDSHPSKKLKTGSSSEGAGHASANNASSSKTEGQSLGSTGEERHGGFLFKEVKGDLFKCHASHSLAHCISEDIRMGKGIATLFKRKFGGVEDLKRQGVKTGGVAKLKRNGRFIYYLITKDKYWQKPTYECLQSTLEAMANHCKEHKVTHVSMPRIGCGLDGLKWPTVADMIKKTFESSNITVTVYTL